MGPELAVRMPSLKSLSEQGGAGTAARHRAGLQPVGWQKHRDSTK